MPILDDILEHKVLGREYKRGRVDGRAEGVRDGEWKIIRRLLAERFGDTPPWVEERLAAMAPAEIEDLSVRLCHAANLRDLF